VRALVIAGGDRPSETLVRRLAAAADLVVAADSGADAAIAYGLAPDAVVGDMDSLSASARRRLDSGLLYPSEDFDTTDLQKAVTFVVARGCTRVDIAGAGGGRADHTLAGLSILVLFRGQAEVHVVDDLFDVRLVEGSATIDAPVGTVVSLVAIGPCTGVTTSGLRWELRDFPLTFSPYGIHNEVSRRPARVSVGSGDLLLFEGAWIEHHR
jgi:thiamine pyrophosphokinase